MEQPITLNLEYKDWTAIHDHMGKTLRVDGTCIVPGGGFAVSLRPSEKQGVNPRMLMFDLDVSATGESPSHQPLHHDQPWSDEGIQYTEVGFAVIGVEAEPPPTVKIEEVY
jgi:hypothetical protein